MIQPLRPAKNIWVVDWVDLEEPVPFGSSHILPTVLIVMGGTGSLLLAQEVMRELDQRRIEKLLARLQADKGPVDTIIIPETGFWDTFSWENFSADHNCEVRLVDEQHEGVPRPLQKAHQLKEHLARRLLVSQGPGTADPGMVASGLVKSSFYVQSEPKKMSQLEKALEIDPHHPEATLALAELEFQKGNLKEALALHNDIVTRETARWAGLHRHEWWQRRETRPYLRAMFGKMLVHWHEGNLSSAINQGTALLELNPMDHLGVRYLLPLLHQLAEEHEQAVAFYRRYEQDYPRDFPEPAFLFGFGLALARDDDETAAVARYQAGMLRNIYIAPLLLDLPEPSLELWHGNDRSEPGYAQEFADSFATLWERDAGARRTLRDAYEKLAGPLQKLIELRQIMADMQDQRYDPDQDKKWQELQERERQIFGSASPGAGASQS